MNINLLTKVEETIRANQVPDDSELFAGAELIISDDPNRNHFPEDVFVLSPIARKISWVVFQMKEVFKDEIDYLNKLSFYPSLGRAANEAIQAGKSEQQILFAVVSAAKDFWSNRPLK